MAKPKLKPSDWSTTVTVKRSKRKPSAKPKQRKGWQPTHVSQNRIFQETFVYLMANFPFFFLNKFGISDHTAKRTKNVSETTPGIVWKWSAFNLAFGLEVEQFVHGFYKFQNVHFWTGSGRTEWFVVFSPIVGCVALLVNYSFGMVGIINHTFQTNTGERVLWLSFFTPFIWWDGLFWLLLFRAMKILFVLFIVVLLVYFVAHMK